MLDPGGRVVAITGANRGIGRAVAERLAVAGFSLGLGARDPASLDGFGDEVLTHAFEATDQPSADAFVASTVARFGRLDAIVANAGIVRYGSPLDQSEADLEAMWQVNALGPLRLARAAWPHLVASGSGRIVDIASMSGLRVKSAPSTAYCMSKFAVMALAQGLKQEGWEAGIRITSICPSYVATDMTAGVTFPREKMIRPEDIAELVATLLVLPNTASVDYVPVTCMPD